jgi:hypothetical protein
MLQNGIDKRHTRMTSPFQHRSQISIVKRRPSMTSPFQHRFQNGIDKRRSRMTSPFQHRSQTCIAKRRPRMTIPFQHRSQIGIDKRRPRVAMLYQQLYMLLISSTKNHTQVTSLDNDCNSNIYYLVYKTHKAFIRRVAVYAHVSCIDHIYQD